MKIKKIFIAVFNSINVSILTLAFHLTLFSYTKPIDSILYTILFSVGIIILSFLFVRISTFFVVLSALSCRDIPRFFGFLSWGLIMITDLYVLVKAWFNPVIFNLYQIIFCLVYSFSIVAIIGVGHTISFSNTTD